MLCAMLVVTSECRSTELIADQFTRLANPQLVLDALLLCACDAMDELGFFRVRRCTIRFCFCICKVHARPRLENELKY